MASLKRYRQTSDSNAAARFRDLPPRFKRQKSITETYSSDNHVQCQIQKPKKMSQGDLLISDKSKPSNNLNTDQVKESDSFKDRKISKKGMVNRPHLTVDRNYTKRSTQPVVLSPMDNNLFNFTRSDEQEYSTVNTMNSFSWQNQQQFTWTQFPSNQTDISQVDTLPYSRETWSPASSRPVHQTEEGPHKQIGQSPTLSTSKPETATQPFKDYSETDKRIIEMFKELERVADQKEKEENENGTDRKYLVSHHLRMLMCAIDKYTEGIDDDEDLGGRYDEALAEEKSLSPSTLPKIGETSVPSKFNPPSQQFVQLPCTSISSMDGVQPVSPLYVQSPQTSHIPVMRNTLHQQIPCVVSPLSEEKPPEFSSKIRPPFPLSSIDMQPWDLWSSPSFNVLDVYSNLPIGHNSCETADSTFALFNRLGMESDYCPRADEDLTRTPLYKR